MKTETKILFTDLDGTLLNDQKQISEGNLTAIRQALDLGHKVVISTGRSSRRRSRRYRYPAATRFSSVEVVCVEPETLARSAGKIQRLVDHRGERG